MDRQGNSHGSFGAHPLQPKHRHFSDNAAYVRVPSHWWNYSTVRNQSKSLIRYAGVFRSLLDFMLSSSFHADSDPKDNGRGLAILPHLVLFLVLSCHVHGSRMSVMLLRLFLHLYTSLSLSLSLSLSQAPPFLPFPFPSYCRL